MQQEGMQASARKVRRPLPAKPIRLARAVAGTNGTPRSNRQLPSAPERLQQPRLAALCAGFAKMHHQLPISFELLALRSVKASTEVLFDQ